MGLVAGGAADPVAAGELRGRGSGDGAGRKLAEQTVGKLDELAMVDLAGGDQMEAAGAILVAAPGVEIVDLDRLDALLLAQDRAAERLVGEGGGLEVVEDDVGRRVAGLAQLLDDDVLLALQVGGAEMRAQDQVGDQLEAERDMLGHHRCHEAGAVAVGGGVEIAADILDRFADLARGAAAGALEHHMLEQMGDAVQPRRLVARSGVGIEPHRRRLDARHSRLATRRPLGKVVSCIISGRI